MFGDALEITCSVTINASQGVVYSGGGGAPSVFSSADSTSTPVFTFAGNGGSGGQGYVGGKGGTAGKAIVSETKTDIASAGVDGSRSSAGSVGGISGGSWGSESGFNADSGPASQAGYAILSNGNSVTVIGDNDLTIKGRRDF